ncbi:hypothetical protein BN7874_051 [Phage NCTB]|jgi:hypothetical protein|nr:hypothetical protein BN7874_051 [Phage NCTB]
MAKKIKQHATHHNDLTHSPKCAVHSASEYIDDQGRVVHNDFCPGESTSKKLTDNYKELAHHALDEWLEKGNGTGFFIIKQAGWPNNAKKQIAKAKERSKKAAK